MALKNPRGRLKVNSEIFWQELQTSLQRLYIQLNCRQRCVRLIIARYCCAEMFVMQKFVEKLSHSFLSFCHISLQNHNWCESLNHNVLRYELTRAIFWTAEVFLWCQHEPSDCTFILKMDLTHPRITLLFTAVKTINYDLRLRIVCFIWRVTKLIMIMN